MGQRANLIIVEGNKYELYYDHWCANCLDSYLFWGFDQSVKFFRAHDKQDDTLWLDNIWCEGGAVIDIDNKVLLWFGGEEISYDIPLRRMLIEFMQKNWQGFDILWANEGVADLADYVGYDRNRVIAPFDENELFDDTKILNILNPANSKNYWNCAVSIRNENGQIEIYTYDLSFDLDGFLYYGSRMLDLRLNGSFLTEYLDNTNNENTLLSGIHIDLCNKEVHIWSCFEEIFDFRRLQKAWDGYKICYHKDKFEIQTELTGRKVLFSEQSRKDLKDKIKHIVCIDTIDPLGTINSLVNRLAEQGYDVNVTPAAYMASEFISEKSLLEELFDKQYMDEGPPSSSK